MKVASRLQKNGRVSQEWSDASDGLAVLGLDDFVVYFPHKILYSLAIILEIAKLS
jgi:hypothetical protein